MQNEIIYYGLLVFLAIALLIAAFTDMRTRKIANWLNLAIAVTAPLFWWASGLSLWPGVAMQLGLFFGVFAVLTGLWALKTIGGGDVKLLAALALWITPGAFLKLIIIMALAGGFLTIAMGFWHVVRRQKERLVIPYGVAIAVGGLWVIGADHGGASLLAATLS